MTVDIFFWPFYDMEQTRGLRKSGERKKKGMNIVTYAYVRAL